MPEHNIISPELPPDILFFHILPKLPLKSLHRFLCVCKQWQCFLTTKIPHKLLVISTTTPYTFRTIDCEALEDGLTAPRSLPFEAKPENMSIEASVDGLVCVGIKKTRYDDEYSDLILWNPSTGEYKTLSRANTDQECYMCTGRAFGLYYNSSDDDYKLVRVTYYHDVYIYSLKSDSWRKVDSIQDDFSCIPDRFPESWQPSVLLKEKLYFVKRVRKGTSLSPWSYSIMRFDLKTEKFSEMVGPTFGNPRTRWSNIMVVRGCIHLLCVKNSRASCRKIEMWRMDGDGGWRKVVTYCPIPSNFPWFEQPLHVMKNGNWLMHSTEKGYFYKVDLNKRTKERDSCLNFGMDILLGTKYIETLVSPNQYT